MHSPRRDAPFTWNPAPDEADRVFGDVGGWSVASNQRLGCSSTMSSDVATTTSATAADNGKGARLLYQHHRLKILSPCTHFVVEVRRP